jgi:hypothetical protein
LIVVVICLQKISFSYFASIALVRRKKLVFKVDFLRGWIEGIRDYNETIGDGVESQEYMDCPDPNANGFFLPSWGYAQDQNPTRCCKLGLYCFLFEGCFSNISISKN